MATRKHSTSAKTKKKPSLRELYAKLRKEFTAGDLQKYTEVEAGVPFDQVVAEADAIYRREASSKL